MAKLPRKSSPSPSDSPEDRRDDLFTGTPGITPPSPQEIQNDDEEWTLEEPTSAPTPKEAPNPPSEVIVPSPRTLPGKAAAPTPETPTPPPAEVFAVGRRAGPAMPDSSPARVPFGAKPVRQPDSIDEDLPDSLPIRDAHPANSPPFRREPAETEEPSASFSASEEISDSGPVDANPERRAPIDRKGILPAAVLLIVLLVAFGSVLYSNRPEPTPGSARPSPQLPITGALVKITDLASGWRTRQAGDQVSSMDVTLPVPGRKDPDYVPAVRFTTDPASSKPGWLRFIFLDAEGAISGDVRMLRIGPGGIEPGASAAIVSEGRSALVYGSLGFLDRSSFFGYGNGETSRWAVEISESADPNAREADWTKLQTLDIRDATDP